MLKTLKTIIRSFTSFRMTLDEAGVIHLIPLFLLLAGIIAGVYLVQKEGFQIFKPKATSQNVEFLPGECLTSQDGFGVLKCPNVQIKFTSPIDTGQTSDAGFSLVKTAYAEVGLDEFPSDYGFGFGTKYRCSDNKVVPTGCGLWICRDKTPFDCPEDKPVCQPNGENSVKCVQEQPPDSGTENEQPSSEDKPAPKPAEDFAPVNDMPRSGNVEVKEGEAVRFIWLGPENTEKYDLYIKDTNATGFTDIPHKSLGDVGYNSNLMGGTKDIPDTFFNDGQTYVWWVDAIYKDGNKKSSTGTYITVSKNKAKKYVFSCDRNVLITRDENDSNKKVASIDCTQEGLVCKENVPGSSYSAECVNEKTGETKPPVTNPTNPATPTSPGGGAGAAPAADVNTPSTGGGTNQPSCSGTTGPAGTVTVAQAQCVLNIRSDVLNFYKNNGWCSGEIDKPGIVNNWYSKLANTQDKDQVKNCFTTGGTGGSSAQCKDDGPAGNVTLLQAKCVFDKRTDILPFYQKNNWCGDESNYPKIVNNWMSINNQGDRDQVKSCFEGGSGNVTKTTTRFRFADDYADLANAKWRDYTAANRTVNHTFKDTSPGTKSIFAEFEIVTKDAQGNVTKTETVQATPFPYSIKLIKEETPGNGTCPVTASCCASNLQKCGPGVAGSKFDGVSKDTACPIGYQWCYSGYCISENYDGKGTTGSCGGTTTGGGNTGGPLIANCSVVSRTTMPVNQPVTYHIFASGGAGNYKYYWAGDLGNSSSSNSELVKTYTTTGYKTGSVIVYSGNDSKNAPCPDVNVVGEDSSELSCQKDCKKCTAIKTCGYETYDSCVDDKGNSKTSTRFCQNGATKFRCFANANYNCASNEKPNVYDYLCSACINNGSDDE